MGALTIGLIGVLICICIPTPALTQDQDGVDLRPDQYDFAPVRFISNRVRRSPPNKGKQKQQGRGIKGNATQLSALKKLLLRQQADGKPMAKGQKPPKTPKQDSDESESARANVGSATAPWLNKQGGGGQGANVEFGNPFGGGQFTEYGGSPYGSNDFGGGGGGGNFGGQGQGQGQRGGNPNCRPCQPPPADSCSPANMYDRNVQWVKTEEANCCGTFKCFNPDSSFFTFNGAIGIVGNGVNKNGPPKQNQNQGGNNGGNFNNFNGGGFDNGGGGFGGDFGMPGMDIGAMDYSGITADDSDRIVTIVATGNDDAIAVANVADEPETAIYDMENELEKIMKQNMRQMDEFSANADNMMG